MSKTDNPLIMRAEEDMITWDVLKILLDKLRNANENSELDSIRDLLIQIVPGFNHGA